MKHVAIVFAFLFLGYTKVHGQTTMNLTLFNSTNTPALTTNSFTAIGVGKAGHIWVGTSNLGLFKFNGTNWTKAPLLLNNNIGDIKTDKNGGIWIGQYGHTGVQATTGGLNYFADTNFTTRYYAVTPASGGGGMPTRYVKSVFVNNAQTVTYPHNRVWTACMGSLTGGTPNPGAVGRGMAVDSPGFRTISAGIEVASSTSSIQAIGGNSSEVWAFAALNFGKNQILRYSATTDALLGSFDNTNCILPATFSVRAIHFDNNNRVWIGMSGGVGIYVYDGTWQQLTMPDIVPTGTSVNANAITSDFSGKVYIGTSVGMLVYNGGPLNTASNYTLYTTANGLPSNNIKGICIDSLGGRILISTDAGIAFWKKDTKIKVDLTWDYSAPAPAGVQPKGVVADGVSRLYLKIYKGLPDTNIIKEVEVRFKDSSKNASLLGRLKVASNITSYSDEASTGGAFKAKRTDSTALGQYWFWYLSPEDFSRSNLGPYVQLGERSDTLIVKFTYRSNQADSIETDIKIARPPIVMVHGLAGAPSAWDNFRHDGSIPFNSSPLFRHKRSLTMGGSAAFRDNALLLLAGTDPGQKLNSLPGNIEMIRKMGYAANQLDYICHSMGGLMARSAINWYPDKFFNNPVYKTYGKGFIHKLITINTPHNSSPVADAVTEFIPDLPEVPRVLLNIAYINFPDEQKPFDFVVPVNPGDLMSPFKSTPAVRNLSVSASNGGIDLGVTRVKNHMVAGNVNWTILSATGAALVPYQKYLELLDDVLDIARDKTSGTAKVILNGFYGLNKAARALSFLEWYGQQKGFPAFLGEGDLIVPLASQTARQNTFAPHVNLFYNSSGSYFDASHVTILDRADVGQHVLNMLNSNVNGTFFADEIPANTDPARPLSNARLLNNNMVSTVYDTTKVKIETPATGLNTYSDSLLTVRVTLKDTLNLAYVKLYFQDQDTVSIAHTRNQTFSFRINNAYTGNQVMYVQAVYDIGNDAIHHVDTMQMLVTNLSPLQGFRIVEDTVEINMGEPYIPFFEAKYSNNWSPLAISNSGIVVTPQSTTAIQWSSYKLNGLKDTTVKVYFDFGGWKDTMMFIIRLPYNSGCVNRSLATGNWNNPAIWSKGVVPDFCDSVEVLNTHTITVDSSLQIRSMRISSGGKLIFSDSTKILTIGEPDEAVSMLDVYGTLQMTKGNLRVNGNLKLNSGSTFSMTGGLIQIDGNTGISSTTASNATALFTAAAGMTSFSFTGGTLQFIDPPLDAGIQTINCPYNFGINSVLQFGDGRSTTASNNLNGFGGSGLPASIGMMILDAGTLSYNRHFKNTQTLTVRKSLSVRSGNLILAAILNLLQ
jgi:pimeloyl-ACP methyl ester carboxylesterase